MFLLVYHAPAAVVEGVPGLVEAFGPVLESVPVEASVPQVVHTLLGTPCWVVGNPWVVVVVWGPHLGLVVADQVAHHTVVQWWLVGSGAAAAEIVV